MPITVNIRSAIETAMKDAARAVALKHGLAMDSTVEVGVNAHNMTASLTFSEMDKMGIPVSHERNMFEHLASRYGLQPSDFGKTFYMKRTQYRITGIDPSKPRFVIQGVRVYDNREFRFPARDVVNCLAAMAKAA